MKYLFLGISLFFFNAVKGQFLIPKIGVTVSKSAQDLTSDASFGQSQNMKSVIGFSAGAGYTFFLTEKFSLQPELNFIQKGFEIQNSSSGMDPDTDFPYTSEGTEKYKLNYLEIPILVKATFGNSTKFYVNAGPSLGFGLPGKLTTNYEENGSDPDGIPYNVSFTNEYTIKYGKEPENTQDSEIYVKGLDVGMQLGGGVLLFDKVIIDVRYGLGFTDLFESFKSKNRVLQFSVGMPLFIKH